MALWFLRPYGFEGKLMKSKLAVLVFVSILATGCSKLPGSSNGTSYRTQLCELVQMKDSGAISEQEYRHSRRNLLNRMLH